jgi:FkbM family methyltransferase
MTQSPPRRLVQRINDSSRARLLPLVMKILLLPGPRTGLIRLGTSYGGWWVPSRSLRQGAVAFCAGAGEDISFDLALFDKGLNVIVFDPTPRAIAYVKQVAPNSERFRFVPIGWWNGKAKLKFYAPRDELHVSHSVVNLQRTENFFEAEVATVAELAAGLGHPEIEIIKMDIEGAEHAVIHDLIENGPKAFTLCVEFDQPDSIFRTIATVRKLRAQGYRLRRIESWNYTFTMNQ